jgi:hypothetical protein
MIAQEFVSNLDLRQQRRSDLMRVANLVPAIRLAPLSRSSSALARETQVFEIEGVLGFVRFAFRWVSVLTFGFVRF